MKVCIFGAGAVGGYMAGRMVKAGIDVTAVARGPHLHAMQKDGLVIEDENGSQTLQIHATNNPDTLGLQDYVIVTVKAISLAGANIGPLLGKDTVVVTAMNGVPWWYYYGLRGQANAQPLESVDPGGDFWRRIGPERAVGATTGYAARVKAPGVVKCMGGNSFTIGEPSGEMSERCLWLAELFSQAEFDVRVSATIRNDVWQKIWGNSVFNPLCVMTKANIGTLTSDKDMRSLATLMMREIHDVGTAVGGEFKGSIEARIDQIVSHGSHKGSMLIDLEAGRPMELDAVVGAICEMGRRVDTKTPILDTVLAVLKIRARQDYR